VDSPVRKSFLGLSLHTDQFCLVEMGEDGVQSVAIRELIQPFDLETFRVGGELLNNQVEILKDLYRRIGTSTKEVGVALNSGMVLVKKIPVALGLEEEMLKNQMIWEAEQFLLTSLDNYVMDYQRLPFHTQAGDPVYLMVLVRRIIIKKIRSLVEQVGLTLRDVDVDIFSDIRAILANYDLGADEIAALVDIQREYISFVIINQKEYFLSHQVSLQEGGTASGLGGASQTADLLLKEFRRIIFGHRLGRGIEDLNRIFLLGSEGIENIFKEISSAISVPLEIVNPFRRINISQSVSQSSEVVEFPHRFVASVGIALKKVPTLAKKGAGLGKTL